MVIFGAGASFDSDPSNPPGTRSDLRPPLANELFDNRGVFVGALQNFPECWPVVPYLRNLSSGKSIEQVLEQLQTEAGEGGYVRRSQQLMAVRYYLQMMLRECENHWYTHTRGITNYLTLLDEIQRYRNSDVTLVTFNYDQLLERALRTLNGHQIQSMDDYLGLEPFELYKVHGSLTWGRGAATSDSIEGVRGANDGNALAVAHRVIALSSTLQLSARYFLTTMYPTVADPDGNVAVPAIAIPVQTKQAFECPRPHLERLIRRLPSVRRILIIGWRGVDEHFVTLLRNGLGEPRIEIIAAHADAAREVQTRLEAGGIRGNYRILGYTFSQYVSQRVGRGILADE